MRPRSLAPFLLAILAPPAPAPAEPGPADEAPGRFALTIYSSADPAAFDPRRFQADAPRPPQFGFGSGDPGIPGFGLVRERRPIALEKGINTVRFTDVAARIDPTTVAFRSLTDPETTKVVEQDYQYDLAGADRLLRKYLGRAIHADRRGAGGAEGIDGTLLSFDARMLVVRDAGGDVRLIPRDENLGPIALADPGADLVTRPTLVWSLYTEHPGEHEAQVAYQTDGLTWRADYNLVLDADDRHADLTSWVTILNESGASYPDATLKLIAGDVQRVRPSPMGGMGGMGGGFGAPAGFEENAFFEYHLYTLGRPTTLLDRSTKQIELFPPRRSIPVEKSYVYFGLPDEYRRWSYRSVQADRDLEDDSNRQVDIYVTLRNTKAHGLGQPLPAGRVRVAKRDQADGALEFVGEGTIDHTPRDEPVQVRLGAAFDIVGTRRRTLYESEVARGQLKEAFEITLANHKDEPVRVIVREVLYRWSGWTITESSDPFEAQDYRTIHIPVDVPAGGEKTVTYTVEYRW